MICGPTAARSAAVSVDQRLSPFLLRKTVVLGEGNDGGRRGAHSGGVGHRHRSSWSNPDQLVRVRIQPLRLEEFPALPPKQPRATINTVSNGLAGQVPNRAAHRFEPAVDSKNDRQSRAAIRNRRGKRILLLRDLHPPAGGGCLQHRPASCYAPQAIVERTRRRAAPSRSPARNRATAGGRVGGISSLPQGREDVGQL